MINKIEKKNLSDLDINGLPNGFAIIFEDGKPVGTIMKYDYYQYITKLIAKVKVYISHVKENQNKT